MEGLEEALKSIVKAKGGKLDLSEGIIDIFIVDGDEADTYHIGVTQPFRGTKFGKQLSRSDALKMLRKAKSEYKKRLGAIERDMNYVMGIIPE